VRTDFGGGSLQSKVLGLVLRNTAKRVIFAWSVAPRLPWPYILVDQLGRLQKQAPRTSIEPIRLPNCRAEVIRTPRSDSGRVIVYFHGGGFVVGGRHLHHGLISRIADESRSTVVAVEYRKLPKHPVSTSVADALDGYRYALGLGVDPAETVLMGDSAGGYMTFTVADAAVEAGLPLPSCIVAMSPLVDLDLTRTPVLPARRGCDVFGRRAIPTFSKLSTRKAGGTFPHSPADCNHGLLPPVLIQGSSSESLYPQLCRLAEMLEQAGVVTEFQVWDKQVHVFQAARLLPEARQAVSNIAEFVEQMAPAVREAMTA
jgi:acetyl esterase/lipase